MVLNKSIYCPLFRSRKFETQYKFPSNSFSIKCCDLRLFRKIFQPTAVHVVQDYHAPSNVSPKCSASIRGCHRGVSGYMRKRSHQRAPVSRGQRSVCRRLIVSRGLRMHDSLRFRDRRRQWSLNTLGARLLRLVVIAVPLRFERLSLRLRSRCRVCARWR